MDLPESGFSVLWILFVSRYSVSYMDRIVARSDWFHYYIIICTIDSILGDCNHYF